MSQTGRRVLITGVARFLGLRLAMRLERDPSVERIVGVDLEEPPVQIPRLEFVRADIRNPLIARVLEATKVDTVVHTNIASRPRRPGGRSEMKETNVIGTMQLLAAAQRAERVRKLIVKSSVAVYGGGPSEPSILTEDHAARQVELTGYGRDCAEAETYARDFGRRRPDVELAILRTQNVIGPTVRTSITQYLSLRVIPTALGFDPRLQFLHEDDAIEALFLALTTPARGILNIAGQGVIYLSQAARLLGRPVAPLVLPAARFTAGMLKRFGVVDFPMDQLRTLVYGRVVDIARARATLGFVPRYSSRAALEDFRDQRAAERVPKVSRHPAWERELFEYLKAKAADRERT
jgi:UDP-glucose 4-epimerase